MDAPWLFSTDVTNTSEWADNYPSSNLGELDIVGAYDYDLRTLSRGLDDRRHGYAIDFYTETIDGSFEFSVGEFKGSMTPEALIQTIKTRSNIDVLLREKTSIESLNDLLQRQDLYKVMTKRPDEVTDLINQLEQGQTLDPSELICLNRFILEANYPHETPKSPICTGGEELPCGFYNTKGFNWSREGGNPFFGAAPDRNSSRNAADDLPEKPIDPIVIGKGFEPPTITRTFFEPFDKVGDWNGFPKEVPFSGGSPLLLDQSSSFLFKELTIPADTTHFSFDFLFDEVGDGDYLTANFNEDLLFWFKGTSYYGDEFWSTGLLDISPYAGRHGTWIFGLNGVGEPNARARIDNLAFYDVQFLENSGGLSDQNVVPEPSSFLLLGMGLTGSLFFARKRGERIL